MRGVVLEVVVMHILPSVPVPAALLRMMARLNVRGVLGLPVSRQQPVVMAYATQGRIVMMVIVVIMIVVRLCAALMSVEMAICKPGQSSVIMVILHVADAMERPVLRSMG
jgi:hypothetical protein